jgi:hypothetical protein
MIQTNPVNELLSVRMSAPEVGREDVVDSGGGKWVSLVSHREIQKVFVGRPIT